jgi:hypothetical protein
MSPENERRPWRGASHVETVGGYSDARILTDARDPIQSIERGDDQRLLFDPVAVEIGLREQPRTFVEWGDSEPVIPSRGGLPTTSCRARAARGNDR